MQRRRFLATAPALALMSTGLTGCGGGDGGSTPGPTLPGATPSFLTPNFITFSANYTDYRPAVDPTGTICVFERTPSPNKNGVPTTLHIARGLGSGNITIAPFLTVPTTKPPTWPYSQTRPDWNRVTGEVTFTGSPTNTTGPFLVHIVAADGVGARFVENSKGYIYPTWTSDGTQLIVDHTAESSGTPPPLRPVTALMNTDGTVVQPNLNGNDAAGVAVFGGFASPRPGNPTLIAFAGQPALSYWGQTQPDPLPDPLPQPAYNQDDNYVFLNRYVGGVYSSAPLEPGASIATFDSAYQGRAPSWSPDGNHLVFESSRAGGYALFLANVAAGTPPVQLTDPSYWAQHGKFLPDGKTIVFTALQYPYFVEAGPRGIATIDVSALLG